MKSNSGNGDRWRLICKPIVCLVLLGGVLAVAGCSSGLASVKGKVTVKGEPAKGGSLVFSPVAAGDEKTPGKPASAEIQPDGTFTAGTNSASDGVKAGKVRIGFTPPPQQLTEEQRTNPKFKAPPPLYMGMVPKVTEFDVKPGANNLDIELVYPGR